MKERKNLEFVEILSAADMLSVIGGAGIGIFLPIVIPIRRGGGGGGGAAGTERDALPPPPLDDPPLPLDDHGNIII